MLLRFSSDWYIGILTTQTHGPMIIPARPKHSSSQLRGQADLLNKEFHLDGHDTQVRVTEYLKGERSLERSHLSLFTTVLCPTSALGLETIHTSLPSTNTLVPATTIFHLDRCDSPLMSVLVSSFLPYSRVPTQPLQ